ncbi:hypothetical protein GCM10028805_08870 [Spirosoma harenae]
MLFAVSLSSCKKESANDPSPDMGARVAGTYTFSELTTKGKTYPASETNLKGTITLVRKSATSVSIKMSLLLKSTNEVFADDAADNVTLVDAGSGTVELTYQGVTIARVNGNKISTDGEDESGAAFTISATK